MKRIVRFWIMSILFSALPYGVWGATEADEWRSVLRELDRLIDQRDEFIARRQMHIDSLKRELYRFGLTLQDRYDLTAQLAECYLPYQSDSTVAYLKRNVLIAESLGNNDLMVRARSNIAMSYSLNGRFFEAEQTLIHVGDTLTLSNKTLQAYYAAQHRKVREMRSQAEQGVQWDLLLGQEQYYARRLSEISESPIVRLHYKYFAALNQQEWDLADIYCDSVLMLSSPDSHSYAKAANHKSIIEQARGRETQRNIWLVRSAMADMCSAVRDYGSLSAVSEVLLSQGDVDRAMRYIRVAINDTRFYNSPIRSWRDMAILPQIEKAYSERSSRLHTMYIVLIIIATLFAVSAVGTVLFFLHQNRRLNTIQQTLRESNEKLNELTRHLRESNGNLMRQNIRIADANRIKEVYIGGFLKTISEYINKLADTYRYVNKMLRNDRIEELKRLYAGSNVRNDELKEFYALFDTTFLELYPLFVEQFNELLDEQAQIVVRKAGVLTTELRIYALIRLGINDTTTIAALLHCSVNTVYNYRSRIRLHGRNKKTDFEQQVLMLGIGDVESETNDYNP